MKKYGHVSKLIIKLRDIINWITYLYVSTFKTNRYKDMLICDGHTIKIKVQQKHCYLGVYIQSLHCNRYNTLNFTEVRCIWDIKNPHNHWLLEESYVENRNYKEGDQ